MAAAAGWAGWSAHISAPRAYLVLCTTGNKADALEIMQQNPAGSCLAPCIAPCIASCNVCMPPGTARCLHCMLPPSVLSMRIMSAVLTCGGSIAQETPDVSHAGLEPRTSRPQAGLLLTRLSLALDRKYASSRGYARSLTRSRPRPSSAGWR